MLAACAFDLAHVEQAPAQLLVAQAPVQLLVAQPAKGQFVIEQEVLLTLPFGYRRTLRQGSKWTFVGTIAEGDVYTTKDQVLTVEASNIHEAYIVMKAGKLVGFYLPVERTYSPASESKSPPIKEVR